MLAQHSRSAAQLGVYDPTFPGGDINSGDLSIRGMLARPRLSRSPWRMPARGLYLASSATPPGPGVHEMAGRLAAETALRDIAGLRPAVQI